MEEKAKKDSRVSSKVENNKVKNEVKKPAIKKDVETPWYMVYILVGVNVIILLALIVNVFYPISITGNKKEDGKNVGSSGETNVNGVEKTIENDPSRGIYYIKEVPYIDQNEIEYPTGCEAVSATMAARYSGYVVTVATVIENMPIDTKGKRQESVEIDGVPSEEWYGGNPFEVFVGHPSKKYSEGSYGCYAGPIVKALRASSVPCTDVSGSEIDTIFNYIEQGKPVIVWCVKNAGDIKEGVNWKYEDGSGSYLELIGEHCAVLIGYDEENVYLNDPSAGASVSQPKDKFISNWQKLHSQAIVID